MSVFIIPHSGFQCRILYIKPLQGEVMINPLNAELNPICHQLALL